MSKRPRDEAQADPERQRRYLQRLWDFDTVGMFHHPVSAAELPDYHTVITDPIDLSTILNRINAKKYHSDAELQGDVARMFGNALVYNRKGTRWHDHAKALKGAYLTLARECGMEVDDDQVFIPNTSWCDAEESLRREERRHKENLDEVLQDLEIEKEVPLEELIAKYRTKPAQEAAAPTSSSDDEEESSDTEEGDSNSDDDESDEEGSAEATGESSGSSSGDTSA